VPLWSFIAALQAELERHSWDTFVDEPPSVAEGGRGVVVVGCVACRVRLHTFSQFMRHVTREVLPKAVDEALRKEKGG
jgi:hypothetical protein